MSINMRIEWPVYVFTAAVFLSFALAVNYLSLSSNAVVALFLLLTIAYAWVAWVMIKRSAVLELHSYISCSSCDKLTPSQGEYCFVCGSIMKLP